MYRHKTYSVRYVVQTDGDTRLKIYAAFNQIPKINAEEGAACQGPPSPDRLYLIDHNT